MNLKFGQLAVFELKFGVGFEVENSGMSCPNFAVNSGSNQFGQSNNQIRTLESWVSCNFSLKYVELSIKNLNNRADIGMGPG